MQTTLPEYETPKVITLTDEEIMEELGEAHAYDEPRPQEPA